VSPLDLTTLLLGLAAAPLLLTRLRPLPSPGSERSSLNTTDGQAGSHLTSAGERSAPSGRPRPEPAHPSERSAADDDLGHIGTLPPCNDGRSEPGKPSPGAVAEASAPSTGTSQQSEASALLPGHERSELRARVSVVVPARNEAGSLPRLLESLAKLEVRPWQVIVVDDGSTDGTADVARALGAEVIEASEPPEGWLGKPWACHVGAETSTGTHLLFLDADTWLAPDALGRLVAAHDGGVLSVQPHHVTERPYEQMSAYFNVVGLVGSSPDGMAFGPCLLTTVGEYRRVGGHAAVRGEVIEDVRLAQLYRAEGLPVRAFRGAELVRFRMYPDGVRQLIDGWTKNIAAGASTTRLAPLLGTIAWIAANILAAFRAVTQPGPWTAAAWVLVGAELWWSLRRVGRFRWWTAALFPLPLAVFLAVFSRSTVATLTHRPVTWRDRQVIPS
jgi:hypothetical protein